MKHIMKTIISKKGCLIIEIRCTVKSFVLQLVPCIIMEEVASKIIEPLPSGIVEVLN